MTEPSTSAESSSAAPDAQASLPVDSSASTDPPAQSSADADPELVRRLEAAKKDLALNLAKKKKLDRELATLETTLYAHETAYLTDPSANSFGNIVKGYEAYVKAPPSTTIVGDHHSTRRKRAYTGHVGPAVPTEVVGDAERIFSKSSGSYARALEIRTREHESAVTSEQESIVPALQPSESRKKSRS